MLSALNCQSLQIFHFCNSLTKKARKLWLFFPFCYFSLELRSCEAIIIKPHLDVFEARKAWSIFLSNICPRSSMTLFFLFRHVQTCLCNSAERRVVFLLLLMAQWATMSCQMLKTAFHKIQRYFYLTKKGMNW